MVEDLPDYPMRKQLLKTYRILATMELQDGQIQPVLFQHYVSRWRHDYLTSLREFYHPSNKGGSKKIKVGNIVLVHDDSPRINWKMTVVEGL